MHNLIAQAGALLLATCIAGFGSLHLSADDVSQRLPQRLSEKRREAQLEAVWKLQQVLKSNLLILNIMLLYLLAAATYNIFQTVALAFIWLIAVNLLSGSKRIRKRAKRTALARLSLLVRIAEGIRPALDVLDGSKLLIMRRKEELNSKADIMAMIEKCQGVLTPTEKKRIYQVLLEDEAK